jgi:hypothetical protein
MMQREGARTCTDHDHKYRVNSWSADGHNLLHGALAVREGTPEIGEVENGSNADFLGMTISVICLADRANKAASN